LRTPHDPCTEVSRPRDRDDEHSQRDFRNGHHQRAQTATNNDGRIDFYTLILHMDTVDIEEKNTLKKIGFLLCRVSE
jgi:hypothetical protein